MVIKCIANIESKPQEQLKKYHGLTCAKLHRRPETEILLQDELFDFVILVHAHGSMKRSLE